ncbi:hypothetical protein ACHWQZ_G000757, partial [Mnemiopsis leidyi]
MPPSSSGIYLLDSDSVTLSKKDAEFISPSTLHQLISDFLSGRRRWTTALETMPAISLHHNQTGKLQHDVRRPELT